MTTFTLIRMLLKGRKTYFGLLTFAVVVVCENLLGVDVPGYEANPEWAFELIGAWIAASGYAKYARTAPDPSPERAMDAIMQAVKKV